MPKPLTLILAALVALAPGLAMARAVPASAPACTSPAQSLDEKGFVRIGGIDQWVTIKGDRCDNPVILFLHGGPGNPLSPFADAIYGAWTRDFTLVQWDQRGSGMTHGLSPPAETDGLTVAGMTTDGIAVATYLVQHLGARKVILMGSSWGSILGVNMARTRPDLFHAYVGTSQIVSYRDNQATTYARLLDLARAAGDQETAGRLEALGPPPWANPRAFGVVRRAVRKYEALKTDPFPRPGGRRPVTTRHPRPSPTMRRARTTPSCSSSASRGTECSRASSWPLLARGSRRRCSCCGAPRTC